MYEKLSSSLDWTDHHLILQLTTCSKVADSFENLSVAVCNFENPDKGIIKVKVNALSSGLFMFRLSCQLLRDIQVTENQSVNKFSCWPYFVLYRLHWCSWLRHPFVDTCHKHVPHLTQPWQTHLDQQYWHTLKHARAHTYTHSRTHPYKNVLCFLPLMLTTALFSVRGGSFQAVWQTALQLLLHVWEQQCPSGQVWQISASAELCTFTTSLVPTAITRPVSARHSSLISSRHRSGSSAYWEFRAGDSDSEPFCCTCEYMFVWIDCNFCVLLLFWYNIKLFRNNLSRTGLTFKKLILEAEMEAKLKGNSTATRINMQGNIELLNWVSHTFPWSMWGLD